MKLRISLFHSQLRKKNISVIVGAELEALMNDALWNPFTPRLDENNSDINAVCTLGVRFI